ncbi:hypothetical protein SAMN04489835_4228 [Mycolicibacterium rutilum]|uniref:Uncharacterized protein n=1 Tax=Mycolicibacterium rutilum TaxID=370526 RepID=A0A1H6KV05_MYCRU|nr:hypothetical protein [Mycolicibacterium rutilum]SEH79560.1 hypothetical protein SAMN04489835_4228 [Mycolicibacterium rutilum]
MNRDEIARLVASMTDDEIELLRDVLAETEDAEPEDVDPHRTANRQFVKSLLGRDD